MTIEISSSRVFRDNYFLDVARGKRVLDIGCVGADGLMRLHRQMREVAKDVVGLDMQAADGVVVGDAQNFKFEQPFDACIAGEIIEHLGDVTGFLRSCMEAVGPGGRIIITTPNPYSLVALRYALLARRVPNDEGHVALFDAITLRHMLINFAPHNGVSGTICYYEDGGPVGAVYQLNRTISRWICPYASGLLADLTVNSA